MGGGRSQGVVWKAVTAVMAFLTAIAALALGGMIVVTSLDVVLRQFGVSITGAYDIVRLCGAIALSCALPSTTAAKGHIAVEYFFHKLKQRGRRMVDTLVHGGMVAAFGFAAWQCVRAGNTFLRTGEVSATLQVPLFWVPWVMAAGCALAGMASMFHLLNPGREMTRP
jgi:TRAP-type C4-dicarboxylate transport system permease small subunit